MEDNCCDDAIVCCENGCCECSPRAKTSYFSLAAGIVFGIAWFLLIDAIAYSSHINGQSGKKQEFKFIFILPAVGTTLAFFCINTIDWGALNADEFMYSSPRVKVYARIAVCFGVMLGVGSIVGSIFILANDFGKGDYFSQYPGIAIMLNAIFIFLSTWVMRFGTAVETW